MKKCDVVLLTGFTYTISQLGHMYDILRQATRVIKSTVKLHKEVRTHPRKFHKPFMMYLIIMGSMQVHDVNVIQHLHQR